MKKTPVAIGIAVVLLCVTLVSARLIYGQSQWFKVGEGNYKIAGSTKDGGVVAFAVPYGQWLVENQRPQSDKPGVCFSIGAAPIIRTTRVDSKKLPQSPKSVQAGLTSLLTMTVSDETFTVIPHASDLVYSRKSRDGSTVVWNERSAAAIWASGTKDWAPRQVTDDSARSKLIEAVRDRVPEGWSLYWAYNPVLLADGRTIVFQSNRNTKDFVDGLSLWAVDLDGTNERLLLDASEFASGQGHLELLGEYGNCLLVYEGKERKVYLVDRESFSRKMLLEGVLVVSASPDGRYLVTQPPFAKEPLAVYSVRDGSSTAITIPSPYVFNDVGVWNDDCSQFAFYGYDQSQPTGTRLVTLTLSSGSDPVVSVYASPVPMTDFEMSGALSWAGDSGILASLTNGQSWLLVLRPR